MATVQGGRIRRSATNPPANPPQHVIRFCVAFGNRASGFYANHHPVANYWYTYELQQPSRFQHARPEHGADVNVGILRNNVAYGAPCCRTKPAATTPTTRGRFRSPFRTPTFRALRRRVILRVKPRQPAGDLLLASRDGQDLIDKGRRQVALQRHGARPRRIRDRIPPARGERAAPPAVQPARLAQAARLGRGTGTAGGSRHERRWGRRDGADDAGANGATDGNSATAGSTGAGGTAMAVRSAPTAPHPNRVAAPATPRAIARAALAGVAGVAMAMSVFDADEGSLNAIRFRHESGQSQGSKVIRRNVS